ncbi:MAG: 50S ribosomal protein L11 methyltransferase [Myxococcales bacterium]|nr:50S ribosomal protein L11 methyltransferase [Myxococcales bacterium]
MNEGKAGSFLYVLKIEAPAYLADAIAAHLFDFGLRGLEEQPSGDRLCLLTYGEDRRQIEQYASLAERFVAGVREFDPAAAAVTIRIDERPNDEWATSWMQHFRQTAITPRLVVQPSWDDTPAPPGARRLIIEPKMAFGFGTHATTQLAARSIERACLERPACRVLDVGTGTGILALVALLHGACYAVGTDIDEVAVQSARENAELNGLADRCEFTGKPLAAIGGPYDLVIANITAPALIELAADLTRLTDPQGQLALTGVLAEFKRDVLAVYDELGMQLRFEEEQDEWCLLELIRA